MLPTLQELQQLPADQRPTEIELQINGIRALSIYPDWDLEIANEAFQRPDNIKSIWITADGQLIYERENDQVRLDLRDQRLRFRPTTSASLFA